MTLKLKAIDTPYKGHLFRSRTEARWAVFFDKLNLQWEYEHEGYVLPDGTRYLPDFLVRTPQGQKMWIEVKPTGQHDDPKFSKFKEALDYSARAVLVGGTPLDWLNSGRTFCPRCGHPLPADQGGSFGVLYYYCGFCDGETPSGSGNPYQIDGITAFPYEPYKGDLRLQDETHWQRYNRTLHTFAEAAQKARFEHGATGQ